VSATIEWQIGIGFRIRVQLDSNWSALSAKRVKDYLFIMPQFLVKKQKEKNSKKRAKKFEILKSNKLN